MSVLTLQQRHRVAVLAPDPLSRAGVASQLRAEPELQVVDDGDARAATLAVVVTDRVDDAALALVAQAADGGRCRVLAVVAHLDDDGLFRLVEAGTCGVLRRADATTAALSDAALKAVAGDGSLSGELLGRLLHQVRRVARNVLAPHDLTISGLSTREVDVLSLLAAGHDTSHIAAELSYSERTVKTIVHDIGTRLHARNRTHAVAEAFRQGIIT